MIRAAAVAALVLAVAAHAGTGSAPPLERLVGQKIMTGIEFMQRSKRRAAKARP